MKAWQVTRPGTAEFDHDVAPPLLDTSDENSTIVDVRAAAISFADRLMIDGKYQLRPRRPFVPGFELTGVVTATNSPRLAVGDRVVGLAEPRYGAWADVARADARHLRILPDDIDFFDGVAFHTNAQTAWFALHRAARLTEDDTVLVHAAAGGVGSMAVQLAVAAGCRVVGSASGDKVDTVRHLGADLAVNRRDPNWAESVRDHVGHVDVVIDMVGESLFSATWDLLDFESRYVAVGFASGRAPSIRADRALVKNVSVHGVYWTPYADRRPDLVDEAAAEIFELYRTGRLDPCLGSVEPLDGAVRSADRVWSGATTGKIVIDVSGPP